MCLVRSGADVETVAEWLRIDQDAAKLVLFREEGSRRCGAAELERSGPWPGSAVTSRAAAREAQLEAQALSQALLGLVPGGLAPAEAVLEELSEAMGPVRCTLRSVAELARAGAHGAKELGVGAATASA